MASNSGNGFRLGAVADRWQMFNPESGLWTVFNSAGNFLRTKKSPGPWKGIKVGPPKNLGK